MINRVQGPMRAMTSQSSTVSVELIQAPINGTVLVMCVGHGQSSGVMVDSISQDGVTWQKIVSQGDEYSNAISEIWSGAVGEGATIYIDVQLTDPNIGESVVDVCEYSGLENANVDKYASNSGSGYTTDTGTTDETTKDHELWIGAIGSVMASYGQENPTYGFTLFDGAQYGTFSLAYLEKIADAADEANSGTSNQESADWSGCIATFKAAIYTISANADTNSTISPSGTVEVEANADQTFRISANSGYHITNVYVDNVDQGVISEYTFWSVSANHSISIVSAANTSNDLVGNSLTVNGSALVSETISAETLSVSGGTNLRPALTFSVAAPCSESSWLNYLGVGLNINRKIVLNSANGIETATMGTIRNTLDDGSGNITLNVWGSKLTFYDPYGHAASIQAENSNPAYQWPYLHIKYGILADDISAQGFLGTSSQGLQGDTGGGAILMGHGFTASSDNPVIELNDTNYNTLWIKAGMSRTDAFGLPWGNLELGNLTAHGTINIDGSSQNQKTNYAYYTSNGIPGTDSGPGNFAVSLFTEGCIFCGGEVIVYSDQRDKTLVESLNEQTAISAVMKLNPLHFAWKTESKKGINIIAGLFAQEVAKAIPEAVTFHAGTRYPDEHALNYNVLTTYALSAIQGLVKELEDLRSQLESLAKAVASYNK